MKYEELDEGQRALIASSATQLISFAKKIRPDLAAVIGINKNELHQDLVDRAVSVTLEADDTDWAILSAMDPKLLYDVYLELRESEGTVTEHDYVRRSLMSHHFSNELEWLKHQTRLAEDRAKGGSPGMKVCSQCGSLRFLSSFRAKGGAVCSSCRGKTYRKNVKQRKEEEAQ